MMIDKIYVGINGVRIEAKGEILAQILKDRAEEAELARRTKAEAEAKATAKAALLDRLGITADEAKLLLS